MPEFMTRPCGGAGGDAAHPPRPARGRGRGMSRTGCWARRGSSTQLEGMRHPASTFWARTSGAATCPRSSVASSPSACP